MITNSWCTTFNIITFLPIILYTYLFLCNYHIESNHYYVTVSCARRSWASSVFTEHSSRLVRMGEWFRNILNLSRYPRNYIFIIQILIERERFAFRLFLWYSYSVTHNSEMLFFPKLYLGFPQKGSMKLHPPNYPIGCYFRLS